MGHSTTFVRPSKSRGCIKRNLVPRPDPGDNCDWDCDDDLSQSPPFTAVADDYLAPPDNVIGGRCNVDENVTDDVTESPSDWPLPDHITCERAGNLFAEEEAAAEAAAVAKAQREASRPVLPKATSKSGRPKETAGLYILRWTLNACEGNVKEAFALNEILRCHDACKQEVSREGIFRMLGCGLSGQPRKRIYRGVGQRCRARDFSYGWRWWATTYVAHGKAIRQSRETATTVLNGLAKKNLIETALSMDEKKLLVRPRTLALKAAYEKATGDQVEESGDWPSDDAECDAESAMHRIGPTRRFKRGVNVEVSSDGCSDLPNTGVFPGWYESQTRIRSTNRRKDRIDQQKTRRTDSYRGAPSDVKALYAEAYRRSVQDIGHAEVEPPLKKCPVLRVQRGTYVAWAVVDECKGNLGMAYLLAQLRYRFAHRKNKNKLCLAFPLYGAEKDLGVARSNIQRWLKELQKLGKLESHTGETSRRSARGKEITYVLLLDPQSGNG